jgi:hypothetical protein
MDYNDYYTNGAYLGYINGSDISTFANFQTGFGGNVHSKNILPVFDTDGLHLTNANTAFLNLGTPLAEVPDDIDGLLRSTTAPDMGAVEFSGTMSTTEIAKNAINIYPNPFTDVLKISDIKNVKSISVNDISGRIMIKNRQPSSEINLSTLKSGLYIVNLYMNDGTIQSFKVVKN